MHIHRVRSPREAEGAGVPAAAPASLKPGELFVNRFRIVRHLGTGSLCATYLAADEDQGEVVLKVLQPRKALSPAYTEDFLFLARSVAHYRHPGIARVLESGRGQGEVHYVMEKIDGPPLRAWLFERLTFANRVGPGLGLIRHLLAVFEVVHERGCYGALKPENVFMHPTRGPVILDFGVPGFLSPQEFEFNAHARRYLPYMAPELKRDWSNLLPQSDVYSLGALLYEILVGRPPALPLQFLPSEASARFGLAADEVVLKAMAENPFDRYDSLEAFDASLIGLTQAIFGPDSVVREPEAAPPPFADAPSVEMPEASNPADAAALYESSEQSAEPDDGTDTETWEREEVFVRATPDNGVGVETSLAALSWNHIEGAGDAPEAEDQAAGAFANAGNLVAGDEGAPFLIWILLGVLAVALCVLAAMLGAPATR